MSLGLLHNKCAQSKLLVKVSGKQFWITKTPERLVKQQANDRVLNRQPAQKLIASDRQMEKIRNEVKERKIQMAKKQRSTEDRGEKGQDGEQEGGLAWEEGGG